jgi:hypothetical protein
MSPMHRSIHGIISCGSFNHERRQIEAAVLKLDAMLVLAVGVRVHNVEDQDASPGKHEDYQCKHVISKRPRFAPKRF